MSAFDKEIEIKFEVNKTILNNLKKLKLSPYEEVDEYFFTQDTLDNDIYLRFRKKKGKILLELKRITLGTKQTKDCYEADEVSTEISKELYERLRTIFSIIFSIKWVVRKVRRKGNLNSCEICHDSVDGLGDFLEIEGPKEAILKTCAQLNLKLDDRNKDSGYVKMGMKKAGLL